jgi:hypothetical protein
MAEFKLCEIYDYLTGHFFAELTCGNQTWVLHHARRAQLHQNVGYLLMHFKLNNSFY